MTIIRVGHQLELYVSRPGCRLPTATASVLVDKRQVLRHKRLHSDTMIHSRGCATKDGIPKNVAFINQYNASLNQS
jgi:hypothetical protein